jgi:transcriptional regulator with XRE-family HTH domain
MSDDLRERLLAEFQDRDFRHAYLEDFLNSVVSTQIRTLREKAGWSQAELADLIATTQSAISRNESPDYSRWNIATLRKLAGAFDRALIVKFAGFGEALSDIERFRCDRLIPSAFDEDPVFHHGATPVAVAEESPRAETTEIRARSNVAYPDFSRKSTRIAKTESSSESKAVSIPAGGLRRG